MNKPRNYWNKERCQEIALKCDTRKDFFKRFQSPYTISCKNGWLNEICSHMKWKTKPMYYWTKEKCQEMSLKCQSRYEFQIKYGRAYRVSYNNNWLDEMCSHMKIVGNIFKRLVYLCEFSDGSVYIGLTCNSDRRNGEHLIDNKSSVHDYIKETGLNPVYKELTDYIDVELVGEIEKYYIEKYRELGYKILNRKKGGGLGGGKIKWNYETCKKESLIYPTKYLLCINKRRAYEKCRKEGWFDEFYPINNSL